MNTLTRFMSKVDMAGDKECWLWTAYIAKDGYGQFMYKGVARSAHKFMCERIMGFSVPLGYEVHHRCTTPNCVNPSHLEVVTHNENQAARTGERTHCKRDHPWIPENLYLVSSGLYRCRLCATIDRRKYRRTH